MKPQTWVEEDREEVVDAIVDGMVASMTFEEMRRRVWDMIHDDLIWQEWSDLWMHAEDYAPEVLERFQKQEEGEPSV